MAEQGSYRSSAWERRKTGYLSKKYDALFDAYIIDQEIGQSEGINIMVQYFFDNLSPEEISRMRAACEKKRQFLK